MPLPSPVPSPQVQKAVVAIPRLNLRAGPSTESEVIAKLNQGDKVTITDHNEAGNWFQVQTETGETGWVAAAYVMLPASPEQKARVTADSLNVRDGPGTDFGRVAKVPKDAILEVLNHNGTNDWLNVRLPDGTEGWVAAEFVELKP